MFALIAVFQSLKFDSIHRFNNRARIVASLTQRKTRSGETMAKSESVSVDLRLSSKPDSKVKAFADVTIALGDDGTITVLGFSVLDSDGRPPRIMSPARKGKQTWFDIVRLSGRIHSSVEAAVLAEYQRKTKASK